MGSLLSNPSLIYVTPADADSDSPESLVFEETLARHAASVRHYVRSLMPGYHGSDDVTQEILLKVWEKKDEFEPGSNFKAWVFKIARYYVLNERRKISRSPLIMLDDEIMNQIDLHWMHQEIYALDDELEALRACMQNLDVGERDLLNARYATPKPLRTYAVQEGISTGTLKARLYRLREALRRCIEFRLRSE